MGDQSEAPAPARPASAPARPSPTSEFFLNQRSRRRERDVLPSSLRMRLENMENNNAHPLQSTPQFSVEDFINKVERKNTMIREQRQGKQDAILNELKTVIQELGTYYKEFYKYHVEDEGSLELRNRIVNIIKSMKEVKQDMDSFKASILEGSEETTEEKNKVVYGVSCPEKDHEEYVKTFETLLKALVEIRVSNDEYSTISGIDIQKVYENLGKKVENFQKVLSEAKSSYNQFKKMEKALNYLND